MKKIIIGSLLLGLFVGILFFLIPRVASKEEIVEPFKITPTPKPTTTGEASSIEGTKKLTMKTQVQADGLVTYSFLVFDGEKEFVLFTKDAKLNTFVIPENSWSPDSMYLFLIDTVSVPKQVLIFKASGEHFGDEEAYLNVTELFVKSKPQHILDIATGWDSRGLLHFRTKNQNGTKGPSYWFDVDSKSFIQLAAR